MLLIWQSHPPLGQSKVEKDRKTGLPFIFHLIYIRYCAVSMCFFHPNFITTLRDIIIPLFRHWIWGIKKLGTIPKDHKDTQLLSGNLKLSLSWLIPKFMLLVANTHTKISLWDFQTRLQVLLTWRKNCDDFQLCMEMFTRTKERHIRFIFLSSCQTGTALWKKVPISSSQLGWNCLSWFVSPLPKVRFICLRQWRVSHNFLNAFNMAHIKSSLQFIRHFIC